ncbi:MAG: urease accessory protein UreF [Rhizobiaceae bacterium]
MALGTAMSMGRTGITTMTEMSESALLRLMTWLSPAFPVGAFSYSHGIERAIEEGLIGERESLVGWLRELLVRGSAWNDAVLLAESWREAGSAGGGGAAELAEALAASRERHMETMLQGEAFQQALSAWRSPSPSRPSQARDSTPLPHTRGGEDGSHLSSPPGTGREVSCEARRRGGSRASAGSFEKPSAVEPVPYPVAVGAAAAASGIALEPALVAYLHAFVSNLVQAAVRLLPLGQSDGVAALAVLEETVLATAARAARSKLDDLGSTAFMSEIVAMRHETQYSRVFRS